MLKRTLGTAAALLLAAAVATPANADTFDAQVAWTNVGMYPQAEPRWYSGVAGDGLVDGDMATIVCETQGEPVSNGAEVIDIWAKVSTGGYLPTAFLYTGHDGRTPGVPECGSATERTSRLEVKRFIKDYGNGVTITAKYVDNIVIPDSDFYYSGEDDFPFGLSYELYMHWESELGGTVEVPWGYFEDQDGFTEWLEAQSFNRYVYGSTASGVERYYKPKALTDARESVGNAIVVQLTGECYVLYDSYEFDVRLTQPVSWLYLPLDVLEGADLSGSRFGVISTNC